MKDVSPVTGFEKEEPLVDEERRGEPVNYFYPFRSLLLHFRLIESEVFRARGTPRSRVEALSVRVDGTTEASPVTTPRPDDTRR